MSEFLPRCFFCISLRIGSILLASFIMLFSFANLCLAILELVLNNNVLFITYMIVVTNLLIFCSVFGIVRYTVKKKRYHWHASLFMFIVVLCQVLDTVIILTEDSCWKHHYQIRIISFINSGFLFYFFLVIIGYFYNISGKNKIEL